MGTHQREVHLVLRAGLMLLRHHALQLPVTLARLGCDLHSAAATLDWDAITTPTWNEIAEAVRDGEFGYGMTNPAASNSGFSTLVALPVLWLVTHAVGAVRSLVLEGRAAAELARQVGYLAVFDLLACSASRSPPGCCLR